jgi:hypothetical protein
MTKTEHKIPAHKPNPKRATAKKKRDKGILAIEERGMEQAEWAQKHDPLYQIKGQERHKRMQGVR